MFSVLYWADNTLVKTVILIEIQVHPVLNDEPGAGYLISRVHRHICKLELLPLLL